MRWVKIFRPWLPHRWFAWYPVRLYMEGDMMVWLEWVWRKRDGKYYYYGTREEDV